MKIAVISDIHGNMQALNTVLNDIEKLGCDRIYCLGDLAMAGPQPKDAIELIKKLYDEKKLDLIQGNTDEMIANYPQRATDELRKAYPVMAAALDDDVKQIPKDLVNFLKNLDEQKLLTIGSKKVLLVHGSPRKNNENILPDLSIDELEDIVKDADADLILCGHTHIPCGFQTNSKKTIVNVGSVGRPFTPDAKACYAVVDFKEDEFYIEHRKLDYDRETASKLLSQRNFKDSEKLAKILILPEFRHM